MPIPPLQHLLADAPELAAAWVFGSVARDTPRPDSDLDVAVLLRGDRRAHRHLLLDLAARLERETGRRVDLVVLGLHDPILAYQVLSQGVLVHEGDREARVAFEADVLARYHDWAPRHAATARRSLAVIRQGLEP